MDSKANKIVIYRDKNGVTKISVRFTNEDLWLTQAQLAEIYDTTQQNIGQHVDEIYSDGELGRKTTNKKFLTVRKEETRQVKSNIDHYNLDMILALGYRFQSQVANSFRKWAIERLYEYSQKGVTMAGDRSKQGCSEYFEELIQRIRDIRTSEQNPYQQVTDIYATAIDYDPHSDISKTFFATLQNKLRFAVRKPPVTEVVHERADRVSITSFKGFYITKDDVKITENCLTEAEQKRLDLFVSQFLDFAEFQAMKQNRMTMKDWIKELDRQIAAKWRENRRDLLQESVAHKITVYDAQHLPYEISEEYLSKNEN